MGNRTEFSTILWDVDDTLLDFEYSQRYALAKSFRSIGREATEEIQQRYSRINGAFWRRFELGEITKEELLPGRFAQLFRELGIDEEVKPFHGEYQEALGSVYAYLDDSLTICKSLQGLFRQYVVTNGVAQTQKNKLQLSGLADVMDGIFISEELGAPKPSQKFFDGCFARIAEKDKSRILLVGDGLSSDIRGGVEAGIRTCWYRPEGTRNDSPYQPDYELSDLHQIYDILKIFG